MKNRYVFLLGAVIVVTALYFLNKNKIHAVASDSEDEISEPETAPNKVQESVPVNSTSATGTVVSSTTVAKPNNQLSDDVLKRFGNNLLEVQKCLALTSKVNLGELVAPSVENLLATVKPNFGETVVQLDDWEQFDFVDRAGVRKRARVDIDYPDGVTPTRRLSMFTVNAYNSLEIDNLTNDQTDNPNTAYIDSLKEGVQLTSEEKAARFYFTQGEELVYTMKNGHLDSFNISRGERAINCTNMSTESSRCSCP